MNPKKLKQQLEKNGIKGELPLMFDKTQVRKHVPFDKRILTVSKYNSKTPYNIGFYKSISKLL